MADAPSANLPFGEDAVNLRPTNLDVKREARRWTEWPSTILRGCIRDDDVNATATGIADIDAKANNMMCCSRKASARLLIEDGDDRIMITKGYDYHGMRPVAGQQDHRRHIIHHGGVAFV